jgi:hypothetical protein
VSQSNTDSLKIRSFQRSIHERRVGRKPDWYLRLSGFPLINPRHQSSTKSFMLGKLGYAAIVTMSTGQEGDRHVAENKSAKLKKPPLGGATSPPAFLLFSP